MPLKLNGKPLDLKPKRPVMEKALAFLSKSPADELYTMDELSKRSGISESHMRTCQKSSDFDGMSLLVGKQRYWGHPKAIAELRKQVGA